MKRPRSAALVALALIVASVFTYPALKTPSASTEPQDVGRLDVDRPAPHPQPKASSPTAKIQPEQLVSHRTLKEVLPDTVAPSDWTTFVPERLLVLPAPGLPLEFVLKSSRMDGSHRIWYGTSKQGATLVSVADSDAWSASVHLPGEAEFKVFVKSGVASITEILEQPLVCGAVKAAPISPPAHANATGAGVVAANDAGIPTMDVVIFYAKSAETYHRTSMWNQTDGSMDEYLDLRYRAELERGNIALQNSEVDNFRWRLVGIMPFLPYAENDEMHDDLGVLGGYKDKKIESWVDKVSDALGADQRVLVVGRNRKYGGLAWSPGYESVVMVDQGWGTLAHELGHNFGCSHSRDVEQAPDGDGKSNYGHTWTVTLDDDQTPNEITYGTIMSYSPRGMFYSNPDVTITEKDHEYYRPIHPISVATGVPDGQPKAANNARVIRKAAPGMLAKGVIKSLKPEIIWQPQEDQVVEAGEKIFLNVSAVGSDLTYQWRKDGQNIVGATSAVLNLENKGPATNGIYDVVVSNLIGSATSNASVILIDEPARLSSSKLTNISSRSYVGTTDSVQIAGIVINGSSPQTVLVRAAGPALIPLGVRDALPDPVLEIKDVANATVAQNDDWSGDPTDAAKFTKVANQVGAFGFADGSKDAGVLATLQPGNYTVIVSGRGGATGVALVEIYDVKSAGAKLVNISTRSPINSGDGALIAGFVISGSEPKTVLLRANGPTLSQFGLSGVLLDPTLSLYRGATVLHNNDDWCAEPMKAALIRDRSAKRGAFAINSGTKDAALLVTLEPGAYTAVVSGKAGQTGVALIEVYEVD